MEKSKVIETEKAKQVKNKVKSMLIILFDIKGIVHKEFFLAGQTVNSACLLAFPYNSFKLAVNYILFFSRALGADMGETLVCDAK
jgi:accessory gene regulator protein AgrB